jgi:hypothetical protein
MVRLYSRTQVKILVALTVNAIQNTILADQYEAEMQPPKK